MAAHKNKNKAKGNYCVYQIKIFGMVFKFGKADMDRVTQSSGEPTRIHQQKHKLKKEHGENTVDHSVVLELLHTNTEIAKEAEKQILEHYYEQTGEIPTGNLKSFKPKI